MLVHKKEISYMISPKDDIVISYSIDGTLKIADFSFDDFDLRIIVDLSF